VEEPPQGIQVVHVADLEQPSKLEYLRLEEYFLYRMFQILGLQQHESLEIRNRMHVSLVLDQLRRLRSSKDLLPVQIA